MDVNRVTVVRGQKILPKGFAKSLSSKLQSQWTITERKDTKSATNNNGGVRIIGHKENMTDEVNNVHIYGNLDDINIIKIDSLSRIDIFTNPKGSIIKVTVDTPTEKKDEKSEL